MTNNLHIKSLKILNIIFPYILILVIVVCYMPTFFNEFQMAWDDQWQVVNNYYVTNNNWSELYYHFIEFYEGQYSPINTLVYIGIFRLFGMDASAFHSACLLIHIFNAVMVFYLVKRLLKPTNLSENLFIPAFTSLLFAIHPMQVESVAWISASKIVLYSFWTLMAFHVYIKYIESKKLIYLIPVAILYILSFGSKEQAIILPLNLIVLDWWYGRFNNVNLKKLYQNLAIIDKIPIFIITYFMWSFSAENGLSGGIDENSFPLFQRLFLGMYCFMEYIFKCIAPVKMFYFQYYPITNGESLPLHFIMYPMLILIVGWFIWKQYTKGNRLVMLGFIIFIVNLALVLHILPIPRKMVSADRFLYLSMAGFGIIATSLTQQYLKNYRKILIILLPVVITSLGIQTNIRTKEWKNSDTVKSNIKEIIEKRKKIKYEL